MLLKDLTTTNELLYAYSDHLHSTQEKKEEVFIEHGKVYCKVIARYILEISLRDNSFDMK